MAEKQLSPNNYDIRGFYNLQATTSNHFNEFTLSSSTNNKTEPDISFNPYSSTFMLTYYDSTISSLPFLINDVNLANPGVWNILTTAYNDNPDIAAPYPKVALDLGTQQGVNVWVKEGTGGNGIALYDAPTHYWTGISENNATNENLSLQIYPNPCKSNIIVDFELQKASNVTISIYNLVGQPAAMITNQNFSSGKHELKCSVNLLPGSYLCSYKTDDFLTTQKLMVIR